MLHDFIKFLAILALGVGMLAVLVAAVYLLMFAGHRLALRLFRRRSGALQKVFGAVALSAWLLGAGSAALHMNRFSNAPRQADSTHIYSVSARGDTRWFTWREYLLTPKVIFPAAAFLFIAGALLARCAEQAADPNYQPPRFLDVVGRRRRS